MTISFETARDGNLTCKADSYYIHSSYSPIKESEKFISSIEFPFIPELIFCIEPGLSYIVNPVKQKYPNAKLCALRLFDDFSKYDTLFDYTFNLNKINDFNSFKEELYQLFGENLLSFSYIINWEPAAKHFNSLII
ncbi:MAG: hypothetical protein HUK25_04200, partial [Treponema sp.]|nr:hypothetical protein [Treponema sp.]